MLMFKNKIRKNKVMIGINLHKHTTDKFQTENYFFT